MEKNTDISNENINVILEKNKSDKIILETKISKLDIEISKLEHEEKKISKRKKLRLLTILRKIISSTILCLILMLYIDFFVKRIMLVDTLTKTIYISAIYIGVVTSSALGAFSLAKLEDKINQDQDKKYNILLDEIEEKKEERTKHKYLLKKIEEEIDLILKKTNFESENNYKYIYDNNNKDKVLNNQNKEKTEGRKHYIRTRKKDNY